jgi:hypothetical protein
MLRQSDNRAVRAAPLGEPSPKQVQAMGERIVQCSALSIFCLRLRAALRAVVAERPRGG